MKRRALIAVIAVVAVAAGVFAYVTLRPRAAAQRQQDPVLAITVALAALERSEAHRLTDEQVRSILPLLRILRDTDPNEIDVSRALVTSIRKVLTPEQLAALEQMRQDAQARRDDGGVPGPQRRRGPGGPGLDPGGPGFGPGGATPEARAAFRRQARAALLSRLIRRLENRL